MAGPRTVAAVRQAIYAALTTPPLGYQLWNGTAFAAALLPAANVVPKLTFNPGAADPPSPLIAYAVSLLAPTSRHLFGEQNLRATLQISASSSSDEVTEIAEAVNARLNFADQEGGPWAGAISRAGAAGYLGVVVRWIEIERWSDPAFEEKSARWYVTLIYKIAAI